MPDVEIRKRCLLTGSAVFDPRNDGSPLVAVAITACIYTKLIHSANIIGAQCGVAATTIVITSAIASSLH